MTARRRFELLSYGQDEYKQVTFSDPFGSISWLGLRVPTLPTATVASQNHSPQWRNRYLFLGCAFSVAEGSRARIIGYRQLMEIGVLVPNTPAPPPTGPVQASALAAPEIRRRLRAPLPLAGAPAPALAPTPVILDVTSPGWTFADATTTWHFRRLGPPNAQGLPSFRPSNATDLNNFRRGFGMTSALLYQSYTLPAGDAFYTDLTAYVPPNGGRPYGTPLTDDPRLSNVYGLQTPWKTADAWESLDLEVRGPDTVCAFISCAQTDPATRPLDISTGSGAGVLGIGIRPEDAFLCNAEDGKFGNGSNLAIVWRVGVSMIVEVDSLVSEVRSVVGHERHLG